MRRTAASLLFLIAATGAHAEQRVGSWWHNAGSQGDQVRGAYAVTFNDSNQTLGFWCSIGKGECLWGLALPQKCNAKDKIPVLMHGDNPRLSKAFSMTCLGNAKIDSESAHRYAIQPQAVFEAALRTRSSSGSLSLVIPEADEEFLVARFDLAGAKVSVDLVRAHMRKVVGREPREYTAPTQRAR